MKVIVAENHEEVSRLAADILEETVRANPCCTLGLATGSSPVGMYRELSRRCREEGLDFSRVHSVNLDEYVGLAPTHEQSYRYFMDSNLFDHINIPEENINFLNGNAENLEEECKAYEERIKKSGGIDIQLLGIGSNGHIAFNEPSDSFQRWSHVVALKESTIKDNSRFFKSIEEVPTHAVTMGIGSIMQAKRILIIAIGENKAKAIKQLIDGNVTSQCPASVLQFHTDVTLMLDKGAASLL